MANYKDKQAEKEARRKYHIKNKKILVARAAKWNKEHPERFREIKRNYDKRRRANI